MPTAERNGENLMWYFLGKSALTMPMQHQNWYRPEFGQPYRPLIAMPQKLRDIDSWYRNCTDLAFTGFDPPRTLVPATAMISATTTDDPNVDVLTAAPSPTRDPPARETSTSNAPIPNITPTKGQPSLPPKSTTDPISGSKQAVNAGDDPGKESAAHGDQLHHDFDSDPHYTFHGDPKESSSSPETHNVAAAETQSSGLESGIDDSRDPGQSDNTSPPSSSGNIGSKGDDIDPGQGSGNEKDPKQSGSSPGKQGADPQLPGDPDKTDNQINDIDIPGQSIGSNAGPEDPSVRNPELHSNIGDPLALTADNILEHAITIDGEDVQLLTNGISVASTMLTPGQTALVLSSLVIDGSSAPQVLQPLSQPLENGITRAAQPSIINGHTIQLPSKDPNTPDTSPNSGALALTISSIPISLASNALIIGTRTIPLTNQPSPQTIFTVADQAVTAAPAGIEIGGSTITPNAPAVIVDGAVDSLMSDGDLVVGSKTVPLNGPKLDQSGLVRGSSENGGPFATGTSSSNPQGNPSNEPANGTSNGVVAFQGNAERVRARSSWVVLTVLVGVMVLFGYM